MEMPVTSAGRMMDTRRRRRRRNQMGLAVLLVVVVVVWDHQLPLNMYSAEAAPIVVAATTSDNVAPSPSYQDVVGSDGLLVDVLKHPRKWLHIFLGFSPLGNCLRITFVPCIKRNPPGTVTYLFCSISTMSNCNYYDMFFRLQTHVPWPVVTSNFGLNNFKLPGNGPLPANPFSGLVEHGGGDGFSANSSSSSSSSSTPSTA